ncbi:hypothetical protein PROFUN_11983 [Planoprotostelium fungivorum]|uniref:Uncharacterized protein n=1 Tax=Planoprotostelium fungivorum TaxID=1890364 RepID=A0A2P6N8W6_9EUKA|nr:hypothetical protein PROFUN_11983 [Planoprotostelium fungivorum]
MQSPRLVLLLLSVAIVSAVIHLNGNGMATGNVDHRTINLLGTAISALKPLKEMNLIRPRMAGLFEVMNLRQESINALVKDVSYKGLTMKEVDSASLPSSVNRMRGPCTYFLATRRGRQTVISVTTGEPFLSFQDI